MRIDIVTAFPEMIRGALAYSIIRRARERGLVDIRVHDLRDYTTDRHRQIDDYPYGGGSGMVLKPEPFFRCLEAIQEEVAREGRRVDKVIYLTPDGQVFTQAVANQLSLCQHLVLLAGHYKGIDQRVRDALVTMELSIGDYVLSGGELPALVVVDAIVRLIPGVLGDSESALTDSFQDGLLDAPVYTRPAVFRGMAVPEVLRSGDHQRIASWREEQRWLKTRQRRPDLLEKQREPSTTHDE